MTEDKFRTDNLQKMTDQNTASENKKTEEGVHKISSQTVQISPQRENVMDVEPFQNSHINSCL